MTTRTSARRSAERSADQGHDITAPRRVAAEFRMGAGAAQGLATDQLEEELRSRLRLMAAIWAGVTATLSVTGFAAHWERIAANPVLALTAPPLPGLLLLLVLFIARIGVGLGPGRAIGLRRLRAIEWLFVALSAGFFVLNQTISLHDGLAYDIRDNPMDLGAGFGAPWSVFIIAFAVLAPSSLRHSVTRTAVFVACAFIPELITLPQTTGLTPQALTFLAIKAMSVGSMSALAIYGTYRVAELRRDAQEARQLGQYVLLRELGSGGMGAVYLAEHQFLRRACAVKLIHPEQADDEATLARFEREVRAAARLTHPNTVQVYDYGRADNGTFYYAMEYLPGVSLEDLVEAHGPLTPARTVRVLVQLCGALREAHAIGFVHRDIKPGNVMLCERGGIHDVAKLLDYGLVSVVRSTETDSKITQAGMIVGTPAFMSPEQCSEDSELTGASDIYSLGAVGHFLLTGKPPFGGRSAMQMLAAHLYEVPARLSDVRSDVPTGLSDVLAKCLEKSPTARFENMQALEGALLAVVLPDAWTDDDAREWWAMHQPEGEAARNADDTRSVSSLTRHLILSPQRHLRVDKASLLRHLDFQGSGTGCSTVRPFVGAPSCNEANAHEQVQADNARALRRRRHRISGLSALHMDPLRPMAAKQAFQHVRALLGGNGGSPRLSEMHC